MKVFEATDLQTTLNDDLLWRRRELTTLVTLMQSGSASDKIVIIRAAIPLLYAHWEGFGKTCGTRYLEFVSYKRIKFLDLRPSFLYMASIGSLREMSKRSPKDAITYLEDLLDRSVKQNKDPFKKIITTRSNLRHDVLVDLLAMCGLDMHAFDNDIDFINGALCGPRNEIAHGISGAPSLATFTSRRNKTFQLMERLQTMVVNAAINEEYKSLSVAASTPLAREP